MTHLALPVVLSYLGLMLMGVVDLLFVGRIGATSIGAVGVSTSIFSWCFVFGIGLLTGMDYLVSYAHGARKPEEGYQALVQSMLIAVAVSLPTTAFMIVLSYHLDWLSINPEVIPEAGSYLRILAVSYFPGLAFNAFRQYLTAQNVARPGMVILLLANIMNAAANYMLVLGGWGVTPLGVDGSAIATLSSRVFMLIAIMGVLWHWDRGHDRLMARLKLRVDLTVLRALLRLGVPAAFQMTFEVGAFALSTTLAARLAPHALAAHQIVLNVASLTFMVPLGLGTATAVLVGQALGRKAPLEATRMGYKGLWLGLGFMSCSAITLMAATDWILGIFTTDEAVLILGRKIILIAGFFQLSDGAQTVLTGALRGLGQTRQSMYANLGGHWLIGLPIGLLLCFVFGYGLPGLWVGLSMGLTSVAAVLFWVWRSETARLSES